jgi:hypothetical protein
MKTATKETTITLPAKAFWEMVKACENLKEYERLWNPLLERARGAELALEAYKRDTEITIANYEGQISAYEENALQSGCKQLSICARCTQRKSRSVTG